MCGKRNFLQWKSNRVMVMIVKVTMGTIELIKCKYFIVHMRFESLTFSIYKMWKQRLSKNTKSFKDWCGCRISLKFLNLFFNQKIWFKIYSICCSKKIVAKIYYHLKISCLAALLPHLNPHSPKTFKCNSPTFSSSFPLDIWISKLNIQSTAWHCVWKKIENSFILY